MNYNKNDMKKLLLITILMLLLKLSFSQNGNISGLIKSSSDSLMPFVEVTLFDLNNSIIMISYTDFDGKFKFPKLKTGIYKFKTSYLCYIDTVINNISVLPYKDTSIIVNIKKVDCQYLVEPNCPQKNYLCEIIDVYYLPYGFKFDNSRKMYKMEKEGKIMIKKSYSPVDCCYKNRKFCKTHGFEF